ncbi:MAG: PQQ-dependent sugar dehydrogenase [Planctomycetota bacterium]
MGFGSALAAAGPGAQAATTSDPFPEAVEPDGTVVQTRKVATVPSASGPARLNRLVSPYDGSGRVFVNDQRGQLYVVTPGDASDLPAAELFLDLNDFPISGQTPRVTFEGGFQSFTFHPEFAGNGKFYTFHTVRGRNATPDFDVTGNDAFNILVNEWTDPTPGDNVYDGAAPRELLRIGSPGDGHFGSALAFNHHAQPGDADYGNLYVSIGDTGFPADRFDTGQDRNNLSASILRIDPAGTNGVNGRYGVPDDNPFLDDGDVFDEVFALGVRNPQSLTFDPETGRGFFADIGSGVVEEVNLLTPGANYGWSEREGPFGFVPGPGGDPSDVVDLTPTPAGFTDPIAAYDHDEGFAITGGPVVRNAASALNGRYLFGDLVRGRLFTINADDPSAGGIDGIREVLLTDETGTVEGDFLDLLQAENASITRADLRFGEDEFGNLYLINKQDSTIRVLVNAGLAGDFDGNGIVAQGDLNRVLNNWGLPRGDWENADDFATLAIDQEELNRVLNNWGSTAGVAPNLHGSDVPEPGWAAGLVGIAALRARRRGT